MSPNWHVENSLAAKNFLWLLNVQEAKTHNERKRRNIVPQEFIKLAPETFRISELSVRASVNLKDQRL